MPTTQQFVECIFVESEGHEDEVGDPSRFGQVGLARALAAAQHLARLLETGAGRLPAASQRHVDIDVTSRGPTRPIRSNITAEGRAMNRRVEIRWRVRACPDVA
jgi:outer membrane protein OmpA-like peptidoglycan-associated protein